MLIYLAITAPPSTPKQQQTTQQTTPTNTTTQQTKHETAGFIETARYRALRTSGYTARWAAAAAADPKLSYDDAAWTQPVSIWWQFIPYFLLGAAEAFTNVGVLELFFTQVSEGMRALGASMYLLSVR